MKCRPFQNTCEERSNMAIALNLWVALNLRKKNNVFQLLHGIKNIQRSKFYQ